MPFQTYSVKIDKMSFLRMPMAQIVLIFGNATLSAKVPGKNCTTSMTLTLSRPGFQKLAQAGGGAESAPS